MRETNHPIINKQLNLFTMNVTKQYSSKSAAKKALSRIFGAGTFHSNGCGASHRFCNGEVKSDGTLTLSSTYWTESSLWEIMEKGIDAV